MFDEVVRAVIVVLLKIKLKGRLAGCDRSIGTAVEDVETPVHYIVHGAVERDAAGLPQHERGTVIQVANAVYVHAKL